MYQRAGMSKGINKLLFILLSLGIVLLSGCSPNEFNAAPSDFLFIMDVKSAGEFENCVNVNIKIEANGKGRYEIYDTGCAIEFDTNHMVTYKRNQVIAKGKFTLSNTELERLWHTIDENNFFNLSDDYRRVIGSSYAFIVIEADGEQHTVDNIGVEVPEVRAIVETTDSIMPEAIHLDYGQGFVP